MRCGFEYVLVDLSFPTNSHEYRQPHKPFGPFCRISPTPFFCEKKTFVYLCAIEPDTYCDHILFRAIIFYNDLNGAEAPEKGAIWRSYVQKCNGIKKTASEAIDLVYHFSRRVISELGSSGDQTNVDTKSNALAFETSKGVFGETKSSTVRCDARYRALCPGLLTARLLKRLLTTNSPEPIFVKIDPNTLIGYPQKGSDDAIRRLNFNGGGSALYSRFDGEIRCKSDHRQTAAGTHEFSVGGNTRTKLYYSKRIVDVVVVHANRQRVKRVINAPISRIVVTRSKK